MNADFTWKNWIVKWLFVLPLVAALVIVCIPVLLPIVLLWILGAFLLRLLTLSLVWINWSPCGISMLVVYSNSPHWQTYFEEGLLPLLGRQTMVLNWSGRKTWPMSLKSIVFSLFKGGGHENPIIIRLTPFRWPTVQQFYRPFHDARHGKHKPLCDLENELADWLNQPVDLIQFHPRPPV